MGHVTSVELFMDLKPAEIEVKTWAEAEVDISPNYITNLSDSTGLFDF